jgi:threonine synthase
MTYSALSHLTCSRTGTRYEADVVQGVSAAGVPLLARYDIELAARTLTREALAGRPPALWRYHEMLPVRDPANVVSLGEGMTPLLPLPRYGAGIGVPRLLMKDEALIPTGTFKARGAAVGVSRAYAARAGMSCLVAMPVDAPAITRTECVAAGAELYLVDGLIGDAGKLITAAVRERTGCLEVSTLKEPYRLEGKKTMAYEIVEQLGWQVPDVILYPAGGGVGLIGIYKGLREMQELGWIGDHLPRLVAVQAEGCAPIVAAFQAGADVSSPVPNARTVAFGINVPKALGDFLVLDAVRATGGTAVAVSDEALLAEQRLLATEEGAFICPEGAACMAAARQLRETGFLGAADTVVVLNTGAGLKYPETIGVDVPTLARDGLIPGRHPEAVSGRGPVA